MQVHVLDDYYLAITLFITIAYQLIGYAIAYTLQFDKLTDFAGGSNFVWLAIITLSFSDHVHARQIIVSLFLMLWATRLAGFLLFRILKTSSDTRFDGMRDKPLRYLGFWVFQMLWVWTVSLPVTIINSPKVWQYRQPSFGQASDVIGIIMWVAGFVLEAVSDLQKFQFKQRKPPKEAVCNVGFFRWSRHPNYMGEILIQFAIFTIAVTPASVSGSVPSGSGAYAALYASILGPVFLTALLMFLSGLPLQERPAAKKKYEAGGEQWTNYKDWLESTSILIPLPPSFYKKMPTIVRRTILLEFPMYVFDPAKHAEPAKVTDDEQSEGNGASGEQRQQQDA